MSSTALYPADVYHIAFETIDAQVLRVIVFEEDEDTGGRSVFDIIEIDTKASIKPMIDIVTKFLARSSTPPKVHYYAHWNADLGRLRTEPSRVRRIIESYPGKTGCSDKMMKLFNPKAEDRPFA